MSKEHTSTTREKLSAGRIAEAALDMLDEGGVAGFSMRKLAARLRVDPMAIYHHHKSKDALIHAVLNELMQRCPIPPSGGTWQQDLRDLCQGLRDLAKIHPGAFRIYETYERGLPAENTLHEAIFATLEGGGFGPENIKRAAHLLLAFTESFAVDEISGWFEMRDEPAYQEGLSHKECPTLVRVSGAVGDTDLDAEFAFGLNVMITGLESELAKT